VSIEDVYALMTRAQELPYGEARTVLVEDALRRAEAAGDEVLAFRVRVRLTDAYQFGGEPAKAFATFGRTLAEHDRDPGRFDEPLVLLWQMKAVVSSLTKFPEIPLDRTRAVLDDMERRYRAGGHSLQAVYRRRHIVARHLGDPSADEWFAKWRAAQRDQLSDCEGCDPTGMVAHLADAGRYEEAAEIAAPVLASELSCKEQPQGIQTAMLPVYLRTSRPEAAADAHRRAYRAHRRQVADLGDIADHLEFCALTGNDARGLEIVQRHLGWLDRAPHAHAEMMFAAAAAAVLGRVAASGRDGVTVRRPASGGRPAGDVPVAELRAELEGRATDLAARFDARNGTSHQGDKVRALLAAEPVFGFVPLAAHHRRPSPAPAPEPVRQDDDIASIDDLDALLAIADERRTSRDIPRTLAAWRRFDALAETAAPTPLQSARRLDGRGVELAMDGDREGAVAAWEEASRLFAELGEEEQRHRVMSRLGALRFELGDERGLAEMTAAADHFAAHPGEEGAGTAALLRLAGAHLDRDRPADALAALDRVVPDDAPDRAGELWFLRGRALLENGDEEGAVPALRRSVAEARASDDHATAATPALLLAQILVRRPPAEGGTGPAEEAFALFDEVIGLLREPSPMRAIAHTERGLALLSAGRAADAVADLAEAVAAWTAEGMREQAVRLRVDLAAAYLEAGRHLEAAEAAEEALPGLDEGDARRCRLILAHAQKKMGEEDGADTFASLAETAVKDGEPGAAAHFLEEAAEILTNLDKDALAAERFGEAADMHAGAGDPQGAVRARRRAAMCHLWSGEPEQALATVEAARAALDALPDGPPRTWETALVSYDQARILAQTGRPADAEPHASAAVDGFQSLDETGPADQAAALLADIRSALQE
jgi:tetratricopeptide (TPR) repeat protein